MKFSKILFCLVLTAQSRLSQVASLSRVFAGHFWRLVREWKVQSRGLLRDFRGSARDSLAGRPSMPNLIVILFNLLYPVFVVGIYCKGCVIVRESVKTQAIEE